MSEPFRMSVRTLAADEDRQRLLDAARLAFDPVAEAERQWKATIGGVVDGLHEIAEQHEIAAEVIAHWNATTGAVP